MNESADRGFSAPGIQHIDINYEMGNFGFTHMEFQGLKFFGFFLF